VIVITCGRVSYHVDFKVDDEQSLAFRRHSSFRLYDASDRLEKNFMKKILVPCDFSVPAIDAFRFAVTLAREPKIEIYVLHIIDITFVHGNPSLSQSFAFNLNFLREMELEADSKFQAMFEKYAPITLPVRFEHRIGSLLPDIQKEVTDKDIDLVIMGTSGSHGAGWGSNTEKVIRHIPVPVFAVRKMPVKPITNIVFPVVPSQTGKKFMEELKKIQAFFGSRLHLLWVNTPGHFKTDSAARADLTQFVDAFNLGSVTINTRSDYSVELGILRFAKETDAQLIAMATHQRKGLAHFFVGSDTEDIAKDADFLLWTYTIR